MVALVGCSSTSSSSAGKVGAATDGSEVAIEKSTINYVK